MSCRIGSASRNSLAITIAALAEPDPARHARSRHRAGTPMSALESDAAERWPRSNAPSLPRANCGTAWAARNASRIKVPRPGPSSTRRSGDGRPMPSHTIAAPKSDQLAENLADFGSGDEISAGADGGRPLPIAMLGMFETRPHVLVHRQRSMPRDALAQDVEQRNSVLVSRNVGHRLEPGCAWRPHARARCQ